LLTAYRIKQREKKFVAEGNLKNPLGCLREILPQQSY
jgi:hypothetical protein